MHDQEEREEQAKRARADERAVLASRVEALTNRAVQATADQISSGTDRLYRSQYGNQAEKAKQADIKNRERMVAAGRVSRTTTAQILDESAKAAFVNLRGNAMYMDDIDPSV